jgi:nicotinate-nucleotide pyrophosphorylase (carboxylating)
MGGGSFTAVIQMALQEEIGPGDVTTMSILPATVCLSGEILSKEEGVVAGLDVARKVFLAVDPETVFSVRVDDGDLVGNGTMLAAVTGPGAAILSAERVALDFLQRMSGIATMTRRFVKAVEGTGAVILDSCWTAPGLRALDKLAVKLGGGQNHRFGLYDMVLIKDNHIAAAGGIAEAVRRVRAVADKGLLIDDDLSSLEWEIEKFYRSTRLTDGLVGLGHAVQAALIVARAAWENKES